MHDKTIIFLPGFMCDERLFDAQIEACKDNGYSVIVDTLTHSTSIEGLARNILKNAPEKFAIVGLSMGGIVALEIIKQAPERVTHLILLNTTPYADKMLEERKEQLIRVSQNELSLVLREDLKPNYLASCNRTPELLQLLTDMGENLGEYVFTSQCLALMGRDSKTDFLPNITCPTLVVTGKEDTVCTPEIHMFLAEKIPSATLMIIPHCGHLSTIEQADTVSLALLNILNNGHKLQNAYMKTQNYLESGHTEYVYH